MTFVFDPPERPSIAIANEDSRFPVRRIFCVGRNYAKHAREMGADPERDPPFFFCKPADAIVDAGVDLGAELPYPPQTTDFHHEIELAVAIGVGGTAISSAEALRHVFGYAVAIDLTRRDLQAAAKAKGRPWDLAKGFDRSAPTAALHTVADVGHPSEGRIWLRVGDEVRQDADLQEMTWTVPEIISILSRSVALAAGDLIFTGTPAGVGPLSVGDTVQGGVAGLSMVSFAVTEGG